MSAPTSGGGGASTKSRGAVGKTEHEEMVSALTNYLSHHIPPSLPKQASKQAQTLKKDKKKTPNTPSQPVQNVEKMRAKCKIMIA
jgi:hypothetical protein